VLSFHCSTASEIEEVLEYEVCPSALSVSLSCLPPSSLQMCGYAIKIGTPLACSEDVEAQLLDRLRQLEVVGYRDKQQ
jgi:hypothetical protein